MKLSFDLLEGLVKGVLPDKWRGVYSVGGKKTPLTAVEKVDCGLNLLNQKAWLKVRFVDASGTHTLMGKMAAAEAGQQGGADEITLDGKALDKDDVVFGLQFALFPPKANVIIAYKVDGDERYEFVGALKITDIIG